MKGLLFFAADLWMIYAGLRYGWKFLREHGNYLLGLEWLVVGVSGVNFLVWALLGADETNTHIQTVYFFDAFSRSVGITLILVMGFMRVTHRYKPSVATDVAAFGLAIAAGLYLQQFGGDELHVGPATFFLVVNALTLPYLIYISRRLWSIGDTRFAVRAGLATAAGFAIALTYDFLKFGFDDEHRTIFFTAALATWGTQLFLYFRAYRALHDHNVATGLEQALEPAPSVSPVGAR